MGSEFKMAGKSTVESPSAADDIIKFVKQLQIARPVVQMYKENWEIPEILQFKGPDAQGNFCVFCENICHHFRDTSAPRDFFSHQILSSITKLHKRCCPALEPDKFLSGVKTVQILQFARHDLKKKFLSAPTITKLKIWQRQILSRFLDGPNKFCQSSASGP